MTTKGHTMNVYEEGLTREEAWTRYSANHPNVLASYGHQSGGRPNCGCAKCDPENTRPKPNVLA